MTCRSGCSAVINNATNSSNSGGPGVNGIDRRILNYDKYLKVAGDVSDLSLEIPGIFLLREDSGL